VKDFSPAAKSAHLREFLRQVVGKPCVLVGASLGGGIAINAAVETCPELVKGVILIDAQVYRCPPVGSSQA
jgi:pimeloyl-ACP methyl ester carboxylesterase